MDNKTPKKIKVQDVAIDDNKIPPQFLLKYGETFYIMKAGLEWKAVKLYGLGGYSIDMKPILMEHEKKHYIFEATFKDNQTGAVFVNFGEANLNNSNSMMAKNLLHLAITRAECRVLRMATACGYASFDEVLPQKNGDQQQSLPDDNEPADEKLIETIYSLGGTRPDGDFTKGQARATIKELARKKK